MVRLKVNGIEEEVAAVTVGELLAARGIDRGARFLAIALNGVLVRRAHWDEVRLGSGDAVEIVRPLQGG